MVNMKHNEKEIVRDCHVFAIWYAVQMFKWMWNIFPNVYTIGKFMVLQTFLL